MLIKVPVLYNSVLLIYSSYGQSLKSPRIWFWQLGKNHSISQFGWMTGSVDCQHLKPARPTC